jgi:thioredoxin-related protein
MPEMKRILLAVIALLAISPLTMADNKKKKAASTKTTATKQNDIKWMTTDEVQVAMKKKPKRVFIDVYTGWCGWCKVMDKKTFSNQEVIKYMNEHFYAVKLDAERTDTLRFAGKMYYYVPDYKANTLAVELLRGQMSYPTSVILEENFQTPQVVPGYLDVPTIERVLRYINENNKTKSWDDYSKDFKPSWVQAQG